MYHSLMDMRQLSAQMVKSTGLLLVGQCHRLACTGPIAMEMRDH